MDPEIPFVFPDYKDPPCLFGLFSIDEPALPESFEVFHEIEQYDSQICDGEASVKSKEILSSSLWMDSSIVPETYMQPNISPDLVPDSINPGSEGEDEVKDGFPTKKEVEKYQEWSKKDFEERTRKMMARRESLEHKRWFLEELSKYWPSFKFLFED